MRQYGARFAKTSSARIPVARELILIDHVVENASEFDIIHFHTGYPHFAVCRYLPVPHVTTLHGRLDLADFVAVHERFGDVPLISISNAQRAPINSANWQATIYHPLLNDPHVEWVGEITDKQKNEFLGKAAQDRSQSRPG